MSWTKYLPWNAYNRAVDAGSDDQATVNAAAAGTAPQYNKGIQGAWNDVTGQTGVNEATKRAQDAANNIIAPGYRNLGDDLWNKSQQGAGQMIGLYGGAQNALNQYNYQQQTPGQLEQSWGNIGNQYLQGSQSAQQYARTNGAFQGPTSTQTYGQQGAQMLGGANNQASNYGNMARNFQGDTMTQQGGGMALGLGSTPGSQSQQYGRYDTALNTAGAGENNWAIVGNQLRNQTGLENMAAQYANSLTQQPGSSQSLLASMAGGGGGSASQFAAGDVNRSLQSLDANIVGEDRRFRQGAGYVDPTDRRMMDAYGEATNVGGFAGRQLGSLEGPGMGESRVTQALGGDDPLLARIRQRGMDAMNQQAIARGHYDSGGAMTALGNYNAELDAQNYDKLNQLALAGQTAQQSRIGAGQALAQGASGESLARGGAFQSLAGQQDAERLAQQEATTNRAMQGGALRLQGAQQSDAATSNRLNTMAQIAGNSDTNQVARQTGAANIQGQAGSQTLARLGLGGTMSSQAQSDQMARMGLGFQGAGASDQGTLANAMAGLQAGQGMDAATMARYGLLNNASQGMDANQLAQAQYMMNLGQGMDASTLARYGLLGNMAGQSDQYRLSGLDSYMAGSGMAQNATQDRLNNTYDRNFQLGNSQAGNLGQYYGYGMQGYGDANSSALNAIANSYGLGIQGAQSQQQANMGGLNLLAGLL